MGDKMRVVLLQDVPGLGRVGEVKEVADGYGRNFLVKRRLAEVASAASLRRVEERQMAEKRRQMAADAELRNLAQTLDGLKVVVKAKVGTKGRLYGAITSSDIADGISRMIGQQIDRKRIELDEPVNQTGHYEVVVRLSKDLLPRVKVVVEGENAQQ